MIPALILLVLAVAVLVYWIGRQPPMDGATAPRENLQFTNRELLTRLQYTLLYHAVNHRTKRIRRRR